MLQFYYLLGVSAKTINGCVSRVGADGAPGLVRLRNNVVRVAKNQPLGNCEQRTVKRLVEVYVASLRRKDSRDFAPGCILLLGVLLSVRRKMGYQR